MLHDNNYHYYTLKGEKMKKNMYLIIGITIMLIGVIIQPSIAKLQPKEEINTDPKEYLIQTLIDIINNPDVKEILEQSDIELIDRNINLREIFLKLLYGCPRVLISTLFTIPRFSTEYLDFVYNNGCEIVKIIGEEDALTIIESVKFKNPETFENINDVIEDNSELYEKIFTLSSINNDLKLDSPYPKRPIICATLTIIFVPLLIIGEIFFELFRNFNDLFPLLEEFFLLFCDVSFSLFLYFMILFGCIEWPPYM